MNGPLHSRSASYTPAVRSLVKVKAEWTPQELNVRADLLSRVVDLDEGVAQPNSICGARQSNGSACCGLVC